MKKSYQILFFCMIFAVNSLHAQMISLKPNASKGFAQPSAKQYIPQKLNVTTILIIPANFYSTKLGFFCKQELKFEAATKIPFKFRLGSVQYTDYMEGKPNSKFSMH